LKHTAIILSGGLSDRFGKSKSLVDLLGKPMISHVVNSVLPLVDETLVITDTEDNRKELSKVLNQSIEILLDEFKLKSPVVGALTGFKHAKGQRSLLLSCDTPLISRKVISLLLELSDDYDLVIPKWPTGYIEPLQAAYNTNKAYEASLEAVTLKELKMSDVIGRLKNILYISTIALTKLDPRLNTFLNVNTRSDLEHIKTVLKGMTKGKRDAVQTHNTF